MIARSLALALVLAMALAACGPRHEPAGTLLDPPMQAPDFTLESVDGPVTKADFEGQLTVLFFGFTACPDVCPDTLARLRQARAQLPPAQAEQVQVVFISVDPERDTPRRAMDYARAFDPSFVGLTGSPEQIAAVAAGYGIYYGRADLGDGDYTIDHTASTLVLDRNGNTVLIWPYGTDHEAMAADLRFLLRRS